MATGIFLGGLVKLIHHFKGFIKSFKIKIATPSLGYISINLFNIYLFFFCLLRKLLAFYLFFCSFCLIKKNQKIKKNDASTLKGQQHGSPFFPAHARRMKVIFSSPK
ncbi:MAG: hypothetical protein ACRDE2_14045, partial [Chitinophagaceae bacterium]